jgi:tetratricopeptide (TPR) repeat protein
MSSKQVPTTFLFHMKEYDRAADFLSRSILVSPVGDSHLRKAYALLVSSLTELARLPAAWEICEKGLRIFPKDTELLFRRGLVAHRLGLLAESERAYLAAMSSGKDGLSGERHFSSLAQGMGGFKARHNLAIVYLDMHRIGDAEREWRKVVEEAPKFAPGWRCLADVLLRQGKTAAAAELAEGLLSHPRLRAEALMIEASIAMGNGRLDEARGLLERAVEEFPAEMEPLQRLCQFAFERGATADAEAPLRMLAERQPRDASAQHNLGTVLLNLKRFDEAVAAFRLSLELRPNSAVTHQNLGYALQGLGKEEEAKAAFAEAERLSRQAGS